MSLKTRIISDLHYGHPASLVRDLKQIAPLLEGVERVVFNGDSVELRFVKERSRGEEDLAALRAFCAEAGVEPLFITGNHDPAISSMNHLDLLEGRLLVTHGDVFFTGLSPWSREAEALIRAHREALEPFGGAPGLDEAFAAARRAATAVEHLGPKPHHHADVRLPIGFLRECWPFWRLLRIAGCWLRAPALANAFAQAHRPACRCIVVGHTHFGGVWQKGGRTIVNTGAFLPFSKRAVVDLGEGRASVRRVEARNGAFRPGGNARELNLF